ncbi:hypothetical protein J28TS4_47430 [Paenibacillus lautus]|nr:hypothetical protein J28TS4_47430 [Paenibacillus lautus]
MLSYAGSSASGELTPQDKIELLASTRWGSWSYSFLTTHSENIE